MPFRIRISGSELTLPGAALRETVAGVVDNYGGSGGRHRI